MTAPTETQRRRRGHDFYPPAAASANIPALYGTEDVEAPAKVIQLHYFMGGCDWWLAELDPERWLAFGYVCLGDPQMAEWGYVDLAELEMILVKGIWPIERDLYWTPRAAMDAALPGSPW